MFIELSELNIKLLVLLIFPIFTQLEGLSEDLFLSKDNLLFKSFRYFLSYILSFVFLIIYKIRNKKSSPKEKHISDEIEENDIYNHILIIRHKNKKIFINIYYAVLECFVNIIKYYLKKKNIQMQGKVFQYFFF